MEAGWVYRSVILPRISNELSTSFKTAAKDYSRIRACFSKSTMPKAAMLKSKSLVMAVMSFTLENVNAASRDDTKKCVAF